mmetsp:Transcript_18342/g.57705  ORF Transcript_18342/g.57705 Transcript_18342/m.57705 type:complete len:316 (-) Transcript_18342:21-968(-)
MTGTAPPPAGPLAPAAGAAQPHGHTAARRGRRRSGRTGRGTRGASLQEQLPGSLATNPSCSLLGELDFERHVWCDHEALEPVLGDAGLQLIGILNEGNVAPLDQASLLEAGVLPEEHREHHLVDLRRQVLDEEHVRGLALAGVGSCRARARMRHELGRGGRSRSTLSCNNHRRTALRPDRRLRLRRLLRLLLFAVSTSRLVGAVLVGHDVGLCPGVRNSHRLVQEDKALQSPQRVGGARDVAEHNEGLALLLQRPGSHDVHDLAVGGEELEEAALQVGDLDLVVDVVHIQRLVRRHIAVSDTAPGPAAVHLPANK